MSVGMGTRPLRVLLVDDSRLVRDVYRSVLAREPGIEIVGEAENPFEARDQILALKPDVITLDMEMPRMDGLTFLRALMSQHPVPTVVVSSITERGGALAMEAFAAGAVEVLQKPTRRAELLALGPELARAIRTAGLARLRPGPLAHPAPSPASGTATLPPRPPGPPRPAYAPSGLRTDRVLAIGASTGGTVAVERLLCALPPRMPPILVTQHMPPGFTRAFAERLDRLLPFAVCEAEDGMGVEPNTVLIAPGGKHLLLRGSFARGLTVEVKDGPRVSGHCPSVDVLFRSVARAAGNRALGVILTGMGRDGANGLKELRDAGGLTFAQDEASCVVFGMPKAAQEEGAVDACLPLDALPAALVGALTRAAA